MPGKKHDPQAEELKTGLIPQHVAIIMDGNGRWAKRRLLPKIEGHRAGAKSVRRALETALLLGVRYLTLYTFSLENWARPRSEIAELMRMLKHHLMKEKDDLINEGVRLLAVGELGLLAPDIRAALAELEEATAAGRSLNLVLALSYGSRQEIARAAVILAGRTSRGEIPPKGITAETFSRCLFTAGLPSVDLLIRTSGERRLSNFLLWQVRGAYLYFIPTLWPAFHKGHFYQAVREFQAASLEAPSAVGRAAAR